MRHFASAKFWQCFDSMPVPIQMLARRNFDLLKQNPAHPSLQFKAVAGGRFRSVRVGARYRALGTPVADGVLWFWIGSHADYDKLLS
ncbi:MAG: hypothetical protein K0U79_05490 [Gammaproteobacteria bacterium]|nr:hypothetical protein [Gammaproteobacteria bacterium]